MMLASASVEIGAAMPLWSIAPFAAILLSIALLPMIAPRFWHHHYPKVAAGCALLFAIPFVIAYRAQAVHEIVHVLLADYVPFIILPAGLYTVCGGIVVRGNLIGRPLVNTVLLAISTALASCLGTTGASMLMIRPVLRANRHRKRSAHVIVFFIFLVSNIGGALTPIGDPPLFLGFLHGVPFAWTFNLLPEVVLLVGSLLVVFFVLDTLFARGEVPPQTTLARAGLGGAHNLVFLAGIVGAVVWSGTCNLGEVTLLGATLGIAGLVRDAAILLMALLAHASTRRELRVENGFTWGAIREVAYLFAGIFMTIIPAVAILKAGESGALRPMIAAANSDTRFFWFSGALSSVLDNAPTYLTFFNTALGKLHLHEDVISGFLRQLPLHFSTATAAPDLVALLLDAHARLLPHFTAMPRAEAVSALGDHLVRFESYLKAVSLGSVFMGANTYIGNAPNFMVRSIAEENRVRMPSFFGYLLWSGVILIPLFVGLTMLFDEGVWR
ncbi:MAG: sodium:proton antiporter [Planctomycetota bacterium]